MQIRSRYGVPVKSRRRRTLTRRGTLYVRTARFGPGIVFDGRGAAAGTARGAPAAIPVLSNC